MEKFFLYILLLSVVNSIVAFTQNKISQSNIYFNFIKPPITKSIAMYEKWRDTWDFFWEDTLPYIVCYPVLYIYLEIYTITSFALLFSTGAIIFLILVKWIFHFFDEYENMKYVYNLFQIIEYVVYSIIWYIPLGGIK